MLSSIACSLFQPVAAIDVKNANGEENQNRYDKDRVFHLAAPVRQNFLASRRMLELDQYVQINERLISAKVGEPNAAESTAACRFRREKARLSRRGAIDTNEVLRETVIPAGRRNPFASRPIGHARVTVVVFPPKGDVLLGHIVKRQR